MRLRRKVCRTIGILAGLAELEDAERALGSSCRTGVDMTSAVSRGLAGEISSVVRFRLQRVLWGSERDGGPPAFTRLYRAPHRGGVLGTRPPVRGCCLFCRIAAGGGTASGGGRKPNCLCRAGAIDPVMQRDHQAVRALI